MWFKEARAAQNAGNQAEYDVLYKKLADYPLRPYLNLWQAWQALKEDNDFLVMQTLEQYADIPESTDLRIAWIKSLAKRGQWPHVAIQLQHLGSAAARLPKENILSAWYNGEHEKSFALFNKRWRKGLPINDYEIPLFMQAWHQAGYPTLKDTQARVVQFARRGKWRSARQLKRKLGRYDRHVLLLWKELRKKPTRLHAVVGKKAKQSALLPFMVEDILKHLSRSDSQQAWAQLQSLKPVLSAKRFGILQRKIALRSAKKHEVYAEKWLASLPATLQNNETRAWHVRSLLLMQDWQAVMKAVQAMPESQQLQSRWMYWQAYALQQLNQKVAAALLFKELSLGRGYYSFLSADRLGVPYQMGEKSIRATSFSKLSKQAYMRRAYEWMKLDEVGKASREWSMGLAKATPETWLQALQLAASWGWYDRAIQAANHAKVFDALSIRFPMAYANDVQALAQQTGLQESLIWGVIRQESVFNAHAVSRTGARGLMQLMPNTAKHVSKKHGLGHIKADTLFLPPINIRLGSLYLYELLERFDGNTPLAIAAYNAGPTRVVRWQKDVSYKQPELWVELIPFNETRRYVQQVMAFSAVYDWRQNKPFVGILAQMATQKREVGIVNISGG